MYLLLGGHDLDEVNDSVGVAVFVVVPGDEFDELVVQLDAGLGIVDRGEGAAIEVAGDDHIFGVSEDALHLALSSGSNGGIDFLHRSGLLESAGQVHDGDVGGWHSERHAGEFSVQFWDDLSDGLGSTSGGGDDVLSGASAISPGLARWTVDGLLGGGEGVDGGHETLLNTESVVDDLGEGSEAVSGAGSVRDDLHGRLVFVFVDTDDEHWSVGGWGGDDNVLGTTLQVSGSLVNGGEDAGGFDDVFGASGSPLNLGRVSVVEDGDGLSVDYELAILSGNFALEDTVGGVVLEHVDHVVKVDEGIVDGDDVDVISCDRRSADESSNSAKSVDTNVDHFD